MIRKVKYVIKSEQKIIILIKHNYRIKLLGEEVLLLPQKAVYFPKEKTLIAADLHLGKTAHFRDAGIPVPSQLAFTDLETLDEIIFNSDLEIDRFIILGDLFHTKINLDWKIFEEWRNKNEAIEIFLIRGNHDTISEAMFAAIDIKVYDELVFNKFFLVHQNTGANHPDKLYKLCGHVHPAVHLKGKAKQTMTVPCFYFGEKHALLPSFGKFTGNYIVEPCKNDFVFIIVESNEKLTVRRV